MPFKIAIVGKPNVGKSTLFNKLSRRKLAIVDDTPGVTRDRKESSIIINNQECILIDTAGYEDIKQDQMHKLMMEQTNLALQDANLILFMLDGREGVQAFDYEFAKNIRKQNKPVIILANKSENMNKVKEEGMHSFGFKNIIFLSAEHSIGFEELFNTVSEYLPNDNLISSKDEEVKLKNLHIAVVGRPNAGKSTLINAWLGQNRMITSDIAGTTRDAVFINWNYKEKDITLIDTAGVRKRAKITEKLEKLAVKDSFFAIDHAQIVIMVVDSQCPLEKQDLQILGKVAEEGRGAIIALNKWDLVKGNKEDLLKSIRSYMDRTFPDLRGCIITPICAQDKKNVFKLIDQANEVFEIWDSRISTGKLNDFLHYVEQKNPPPLGKNNRRIKLKYITQIKSRPPTFNLHMNLPESMPNTYMNYLVNELRKAFNLDGIPIRIKLSKSSNPYKDNEK